MIPYYFLGKESCICPITISFDRWVYLAALIILRVTGSGGTHRSGPHKFVFAADGEGYNLSKFHS